MADDLGFRFEVRGDGEVVIRRGGVTVTTLRGRSAARFLAAIDAGDDPQQAMARATGNYRRGNERQARQHRRNRG